MRVDKPRRPRRTRKVLAVVATAMLAASACFAADGDDSGEESGGALKIRLASTASTGALAAWTADAQGFFDKNGLDVDVEIIATTVSSQVPSLLGRQYDVAAMTPPSLISAADKGIDVVSISASYMISKDDDITIVIAKEGSGINGPKDLVGKRLAAPSIAGNVNIGTMYWLHEQGIDPKSVNVVAASTPNMPDLLRTGQVDAAELTMPFVGLMLAEGFKKVGDPLPTVADPVQMSFWAASREWAEKNPDGIAKFRKSLDEAAAWIKDNEDKALELLVERAEIGDEYKPHVRIPEYTTKITADDLDAWVKAMGAVNDFSTDLDMKTLVVGSD